MRGGMYDYEDYIYKKLTTVTLESFFIRKYEILPFLFRSFDLGI